MFIVCSNCEFKYLVNSADLKPNGRMVECANCNHQWFQELDYPEVLEVLSAVPSSSKDKLVNKQRINNKNQVVKNLPSTIVKQEKPSILNSMIVVTLIILIFFGVWILKSYGINTFVLMDFYVKEFFFNLNLIISDLAKIIYKIIN